MTLPAAGMGLRTSAVRALVWRKHADSQRGEEEKGEKKGSKEGSPQRHGDTKKKGKKKMKKLVLWCRFFCFSAFFSVPSCLCGESSSLLSRYKPPGLAEESSIPVAGISAG
jgi:hypothetical protein